MCARRLQRARRRSDPCAMSRLRILGISAASLAAVAMLCGGAAYLGYRRGTEAGFLSAHERNDVTCAHTALAVLGYLRADRPDRAIRTLDSTIDAGISSHWLRLKRPKKFADYLPPAT